MNYTFKFINIAIAWVLFVIITEPDAQERAFPLLSITSAAGISSYSTWGSILYGSLGIQIKRIACNGYYSQNDEITLFNLFKREKPEIQLKEAGALIGFNLISNDYVKLTVLSGISYVNSVKRGGIISTSNPGISNTVNYEEIKSQEAGIPIELQFSFIKLRYFGVGCIIHSSINSSLPSIGMLLAVQGGKLKK